LTAREERQGSALAPVQRLLEVAQDLQESLFLMQNMKRELLKCNVEKRLANFKLGIVENIYKIFQTCESIEDKVRPHATMPSPSSLLLLESIAWIRNYCDIV
jgi:hypothetical protein